MSAAPIKNPALVEAGAGLRSQVETYESDSHCTPGSDAALVILRELQASVEQVAASIDRMLAGLPQEATG